MLNNRTLLYFMDHATGNSLLPSDVQVSTIANKEWYTALKPHFDDLIWEYYADRVVFIDSRFKCDDDAATLINKIKRSFAILLKTKDYTFDKLYETTQLEYNPLWNVDGVVGTIHETTGNESIGTTHTGKDTTSHTGDDTVKHTGDDTITHSGIDTEDKTGDEKFDTPVDGDTTETDTQRYVNTYDSIDWNPPAEFPSSHDYVKNTEKKHDTTTYNTTLTNTYGSTENTKYLSDLQTKYNSDIEVTHGTSDDTTKDDFRRDLDLMIRQGNIGVTKSTELLDDQRETVLFDFFKTVVHECVNTCTYAID